MIYTNKWEDVIDMKSIRFPTFSIISTKGYDPVEIPKGIIENYSISNGGEEISLTLNTFKCITSSVDNDTFRINISQVFVGRNPERENVVLAYDYPNMVLVSYDNFGNNYDKKTVFSYYFKRKDIIDSQEMK